MYLSMKKINIGGTVMNFLHHKSDALSYQDKAFDELYSATTLVNATLTCCKEREYKGQYYGIPENFIQMISNERNEYISLLTLIFDKLQYLNKINLSLEQEISFLQENSDNCS